MWHLNPGKRLFESANLTTKPNIVPFLPESEIDQKSIDEKADLTRSILIAPFVYGNDSELAVSVTVLILTLVVNGTIAWGTMLKQEAVEFCESLNLTLPDRRIHLVGVMKGFGGQHLWLSTKFTFPEITVEEK